MRDMSNYPPGVTGNEPQINGQWPGAEKWERWVEEVKVGDRCLAFGTPATVTNVDDDEFLWVKLDWSPDPEPVPWEDAESIEGW